VALLLFHDLGFYSYWFQTLGSIADSIAGSTADSIDGFKAKPKAIGPADLDLLFFPLPYQLLIKSHVLHFTNKS